MDEGTETEARPGPQPAAPQGTLTAFIDQGTSFEGKLSFKDTVRIDGHLSGEIASENTLIVGEPGEIEASIHAKTVIVSGTISGDVVATTKLVLHKTARLEGNVETPSLVVEEGAVFNGQVKMPSAKSPAAGTRSMPAARPLEVAKGKEDA